MMQIDPYTIMFGLASAGGLGFGLASAVKIISQVNKYPKELPSTPIKNDILEKTESGSKRKTQLLSILSDGTVRLKNGGYLKAYLVEPTETLFKRGFEVDRVFDQFAGTLTLDLPEGTGFQFRKAIRPDKGDILTNQRLELVSTEHNNKIAALLKNHEIQNQIDLARNDYFNQAVSTFWVYIPSSKKSKNPFQIYKEHGFVGLKSFGKNSVETRLVDEERKIKKEIDSHFRSIESSVPFKIKAMDADQIWQALYFANNENANSAPPKPKSLWVDLSSVLCTEDIRSSRSSWYMLHGNTPVTAITLFLPPEEEKNATLMRTLANNPTLTSRHTIITEFITVDKSKTEAKYQREIASLRKHKKASEGGKSSVFKWDEHKEKKLTELQYLLKELASPGKRMIKSRMTILVYGEAAYTKKQLDKSTEALELHTERILSQIRKTMNGADAARETPQALRETYQMLLCGEMDTSDREREIEEQAENCVILAPLEDNWKGTIKPHNVFSTTTGKLIGFNLFENNYSQSPLITILGESGSGKSVLIAKMINSVLATIPKARVLVCDFGESFKVLAECVGGRNINFNQDIIRPINVWDYEGLERGIKPDDEQLEVVTTEIIILCNIDTSTKAGTLSERVIKQCVKAVYEAIIPRNKKGVRREEPVLSHLVQMLRNSHFEGEGEKKEADLIATLLGTYVGNPWLDAPTDETYRQSSVLDVYELSSLDKFPKDIKKALTYRIGARLMSAIGETEDGEILPTFSIFDEMHEIKNKPDFSVILQSIEKGARHGRKGKNRTGIATHTYDDLVDLHGLTSNTGALVVGRQDNLDTLKEKHKLNENIIANIEAIFNVPGSHSQFMLVLGKGENSIAEMIQVSLSPLELWTYTTEPNERNARTRIKKEFPEWSTLDIVTWLADRYPHGLKMMNKTSIDEEFINAEKILRDSFFPTAPLTAVNEISINETDALPDDFVGEIAGLFREAFGDDVDEIAIRQEQAIKAQALGIDIPGVIVVNEITEQLN